MGQGEEDVERAALGVAETTDPRSRGESDIARSADTDGSAKVEGLKAHPSDAVREESGTGACDVERGMRELQGLKASNNHGKSQEGGTQTMAEVVGR
jgi:hypothetical protein